MTLVKDNDLGSITISNLIFAQIIFDGMMQPECKDMVWPATKRGRQVGIVNKFTDNEFALYIDVDYDDEGRLVIEFNVIMKFGVSIKKITKILADYIAREIKLDCGKNPSIITINIAGVKSRHKAKRNTKVVYRYESIG
jgi:Uncharacterized protein conserved in bacteria